MIIFNKLDNYFVVSANSQTFLGFEMTANFRDTFPLIFGMTVTHHLIIERPSFYILLHVNYSGSNINTCFSRVEFLSKEREFPTKFQMVCKESLYNSCFKPTGN